MRIKLTKEHYRQFINEDCDELMVDGDKYVFHQELDKDIDENSKTRRIILKRESDGKYFKIILVYLFTSYECYDFEDYVQNYSLDEVEEKEIIIKEWVRVK